MYRAFILLLLIIACQKTEESLKSKALRLAQETIVVDGHVDLPYRLTENVEDVSKRTKSGDFDFERAQAGGFNAPFMSIYVSSSYQEKGEGGKSDSNKGGAYQEALKLIDIVNQLTLNHPDKFALSTSPDQIKTQHKQSLISLSMGMENAAPVQGDLKKLHEFFKLGIRYMTLTHGKWNHICDSSYDPEKKWNGLSPFGKELIAEMNRIGMLVDISHVSDSTFFQVIALSKTPVIASHSSCRHFTPNFERNMSDDMIVQLAKNGGIIMINYGSSFITETANQFEKKMDEMLKEELTRQNISESDTASIRKIKGDLDAANPYPFASVQDVANHIDHVKQLVGIDHIGLGSDYDGVGNTLPIGLKDVSEFPNLIEELLKRNYTEEEIKKICSANFFRVWQKNIDYAENN